MFAAARLPYNQTHAFSQIVRDYVSGSEKLRPFYAHPPSFQGIETTVRLKQQQPVDRKTLVQILKKQYEQVQLTDTVTRNIDLLLSDNTFTVCTAHQPNLFTGPLYFIYKILHAIRLAAAFTESLPQFHFVPVYYMGSEDADFAELNHTFVNGQRIEWKKEQKGAVGRMLVDNTLLKLIDEIEGQLAADPHGMEVIAMLRRCYTPGKTIQEATFELVHELYGQYGLIVLIPDEAAFKAQMKQVFADDLFRNKPSEIVQQTSKALERHYDAQAHPREINLFYLKDDIRERIIRQEDEFIVNNTDIRFTAASLQNELDAHPERFSPNVILRGLYQETILPNIAFVGGGGELAYWLQLRSLFDHYGVVYPVLVLRNSFLVVEQKWEAMIRHTGLDVRDFFASEHELMNQVVARHAAHPVQLDGSLEKAQVLFEQITAQAGAIDPTLSRHVQALKARAIKNLEELEKKMLRAEKRKYADHQRQIHKIKDALFPNHGLQERVENFSSFYAKWGKDFIDMLYRHSPVLEQEFTILVPGP